MVQPTGREEHPDLTQVMVEFLEKQGFEVAYKYGDNNHSAAITVYHPSTYKEWDQIREMVIYDNVVNLEEQSFDAHDPDFFDRLLHHINNPQVGPILGRFINRKTNDRVYKSENMALRFNLGPDSSMDRAVVSEATDEGSNPSRGAKWQKAKEDSGTIDVGGIQCSWQTKVFKEEKEEQK